MSPGTVETCAGSRVPEPGALRELSQEISLDFAALFFARAISAERAQPRGAGLLQRSFVEALRAP